MTGECERTPAAERSPLAADEREMLAGILDLVRARAGLDFAGYRPATLLRRIRNRMILLGVRTLPEYLARLRDAPDESDALIERLTIKVSTFFRDAEAFAEVRAAVEAQRRARAGLRVWSAGCGHGEEPYSLAILLEELGDPADHPSVVATDVDPAALRLAQQGRYGPAAVENVGAERRERFFRTSGGGALCVDPGLRRRVDFRLHDLASASAPPGGEPFDLVACRNVLIYFAPALQRRVLRLLVDALEPGGVLCLGEAEWPDDETLARLTPVHRGARLFRRAAEKGART